MMIIIMNLIYPYERFRIGPSSIKRDTLAASLSGMGSLSGARVPHPRGAGGARGSLPPALPRGQRRSASSPGPPLPGCAG
jgi:hypothetical protein